MTKNKPITNTQTKKSLSDWSDKKNCLVHFWVLILFVRLGMVVDKVFEIFSVRQSKWLEKSMSSETQKRNQAHKTQKNC